jgi:hypothetical protein
MNKLKFLGMIATLLIGLAFISCNNKIAAYQCPMNCQIDTAYKVKGYCPVCEMALSGVETIDSTKIIILNK